MDSSRHGRFLSTQGWTLVHLNQFCEIYRLLHKGGAVEVEVAIYYNFLGLENGRVREDY